MLDFSHGVCVSFPWSGIKPGPPRLGAGVLAIKKKKNTHTNTVAFKYTGYSGYLFSFCVSLSGLCCSDFVCFIQLVTFVAYLFIIFPCGFNICKTIGMTPFISDIGNCIFPLFLFSLAGSLSVFQLYQRTSFWFHFFPLVFLWFFFSHPNLLDFLSSVYI